MYRITSWCNYRCSYCIQTKHSSTKPQDLEILKSTKDLIQQITQTALSNLFLQPRKIQLIGGEIMFLDIVNDIMSPFLENNIPVDNYLIISNFSAPLENFENVINFTTKHNINLKLSLSFHEEFVNYKDFFKKFEDLKKYCNNFSNVKISAEMVVTLKNLTLAKKIKQLYSNKFRIIFDKNRFEPINEVDDFLTPENSTKVFDLVLKSGKKFSLKKIDFFKAISNPNFPSKGFLCKSRYKSLKFDTTKNKLQVACKQDSVKFSDIICTQDYCSLCNFKYLIKT